MRSAEGLPLSKVLTAGYVFFGRIRETAVLQLCVIGILSLGAALATRGGLVLRSLGIAVVTEDGREASRWRLFLRACLVWGWAPVVTYCVFSGRLQSESLSHPGPLPLALLAGTVLPCIVWPLFPGKRALHDKLAGTVLVPR